MLVAAAEAAGKYADGHLTLFRFGSGHWKAMLGTVDSYEDHGSTAAVPAYATLAVALCGLLGTLNYGGGEASAEQRVEEKDARADYIDSLFP